MRNRTKAFMIKSYEDADNFLNAGRNKDKRNVTAYKRVERVNSHAIAIVLYKTSIVVFHKDGTITLNNGGWPTRTTHRHMNDHLPDNAPTVWSKKSTSYLGENPLENERRYRFL